MPVAQFVPVIGGGFDQDAAQQFQWQQFNRQQDADNFARANAAQHDYNNYLSQLNQLQRQDVATADQYAERADTLAYNRAVEAARRAEYARQFDINAKLNAEDLKLRGDALKSKTTDQAQQQKDYLEEIAQAAENLAPAYNATRRAVEELQSKSLTQQKDVLKSAGEIAAALPEEDRGNIAYDGKRFKPVPMKVNDEKALAAANLANAKLADAISLYAETAKALEFRQKELNDLSKQIGQYRLQVKKEGSDYFLVSPLHKGKKFGTILAEAKSAAEPTPFVPAGIEEAARATFRMPNPEELSAGGQIPFGGSRQPFIPTENGEVSFSPTAPEPVTKQWGYVPGPNGRRQLVPLN